MLTAAFNHFRTLVPHVDPTSDAALETISYFGYQDLESLADFLTVQRQHPKVVLTIKQGVRWLSGRETQTGWDNLPDDREYDLQRKTRAGWEKDAKFLENSPTYDLDVRLRLRLAIARMGEGRIEEAQVSGGTLLSQVNAR